MNYLALYRQLKPNDFNSIIGQEIITQTLKNALLKNCVHHAYLFSGVRGTGKTSTARVLAKAINCLSLIKSEPCNNCINCSKINNNIFMDLIEIDAASNRGIEEIRDLREKIKFHPVEGIRKVYIIDEVHMLTMEAFNALLKTIEDPPGHIVFILATTESHKIPSTILSRCQHFNFNRISNEIIKKYLKKIIIKIKKEFTEDALNLIVKLSEGSLRDAINLIDQCSTFSLNNIVTVNQVAEIAGTVRDESIMLLIEAIGNNNINKIIDLFEILKNEGKNIGQVVKTLIEIFKNIFLIKMKENFQEYIIASEKDVCSYKELSKYFEIDSLLDWIKFLGKIEEKIFFSANPNILFQMYLIKKVKLNKNKLTTRENINFKINDDKEKILINKKNNNIETRKEKNNNKINFEKNEVFFEKFLEKLKKEKPLIHPFFIEGNFKRVEKNIVYLFFNKKYKFHKERAEQEKNKIYAEKILSKIFNEKMKLKIVYENIEEKKIKKFLMEKTNLNKNNKENEYTYNEEKIENNIKDVFGNNIIFVKKDNEETKK